MKQKILLHIFTLLLGGALPAPAAEDAGERPFVSNIRQLTFEGLRSGEGYFSPDGKALIFQSERQPDNPFYQMYILDLESGDSQRVSPGVGKTTCGFFRPGRGDILFASTHLDPQALAKQKAELEFRASGTERRYSWDYDEHMDIFSAKRDGSSLRRLTESVGYDAEGAYSPDGAQIVFTSLRDAYPAEKLSAEDQKRLETDPSHFGEIYLMNADGSQQRRLTFTAGYDGGPFFSPDGRRIIWRRFDERKNADVYTMDLDGSNTVQLTAFNCVAWAPYFHPTGEYVIFTANKLGFSNFELYVVDALGRREPVRVTFSDGFDGLPVFSPDGKRLCWSSNRGARSQTQLFLADWNHEMALAALREAPLRFAAGDQLGQDRTAHVPAAPPKGVTPHSSFDTAISGDDLRAQIKYLASDALEGRLTGTDGARAAASYIAEQLRQAGLKPIGTNGSFLQPFPFNAGLRLASEGNRLSVVASNSSTGQSFAIDKDFRPLSFTSNGDAEGEVVFVGYGLSVPGQGAEAYDSYGDLNVSNKVVLVLRYVPENVDAPRKQQLNRYAALRYKAMQARNRGAKAILLVSGPNSPNAGALVPLSSDTSFSGSGIVAASISTNVAAAILGAAGKDLLALQSALDNENPHAEGAFVVQNVRVKLGTAVERIERTDNNVVGMLPPGRGNSRGSYVLVGAHYDHLGHGDTTTLADKHEEGKIHNGADDNASGVAAVLELAAALAAERDKQPDQFQHGIIFGFWSGEELGLIGSSHFAEHPPLPLTNVIAYLNFDMVGRLRDNKLQLQGVGSSSIWRRVIEKRNVAAGFNAVLQEDPYLPTDGTALYPKGIPILNFFTGSHEDYHRPTDDPETLNYDGLNRITQFARGILLDLAKSLDRPDYIKVEGSARSGAREQLRVYLGTIPDYATEVNGVKLSGVRGGSPADKAGLKGGDVITEFGGQKIANIYDFTYALDAAKIGQPMEVTVMRDGKRVTLQVTPAARP